jgi:hypothetical protein
MTVKMTLLYVEAVGQVVAAVTRTGAPNDEITAAQLAGETFAVRSDPTGAEFAIPSTELATATVDRDDAVILEPHRYHLAEAAPIRVAETVDSVTPQGLGGVEVKVSTAPEKLTKPATEPVTLWALFQDGFTASPVVALGRIAVDEDEGLVTPPVDPGTYDVLAMAAGYEAKAMSITVP